MNKVDTKMESESGLDFLSRIGKRPEYEFGKEIFAVPLKPPEVIEVAGEAGAGKSLLCLDFMASTLLPKSLFGISLGGMEAGVLFIDCDQHFSIVHFTDLMERKIKRTCYNLRSEWKKMKKYNEELVTINKKKLNEKIDTVIKGCLKNLVYFNCTNSNQFAVTLLSLEQSLLIRPNIALIVIDSISSFYWYDRIHKVESWFKMETYLNGIFHKFLDIVKRNYLVCLCTKQSLFKKRKDKNEFQNTNFQPKGDFKIDEPVAYEFMGKEWTNGVSIKINMVPYLKTDSDQASSSSESNVYCDIETVRDDVSKHTHCSFHEDGIRWI